jgi:tetratricopeptide (TPR) repeat protein
MLERAALSGKGRKYLTESYLHAYTDRAAAADRLYELGLEAYDESDPSFAIRCLRRAADLADNKQPVYIALGTIRYENELYDEARDAFILALWPDYESLDALRGVAMSCHMNGEYDRATYYYIEALSRSPEDYELRGNLGVAYHALGRLDDAIDELRQAATLAKQQGREDPGVHASLGKALYDAAMFADAEASLRRAVQLNSEDAEAVRYLGFVQQSVGNPGDAIASFNRALELNPSDSDVHLQLSEVLVDSGDAKGAVEHAERAGELYALGGSASELARAYWAIGWAHYKNGNWDASATASRAALELDPWLAEVRCNLGLALLCSGKPEEAREEYEQAIARPVDVWDLEHGIEDLEALIAQKGKEAPDAQEIVGKLSAKRAELIAATESLIETQLGEERSGSSSEVRVHGR